MHDIELRILFENDTIIAVDKEAGVLVITDQYTPPEKTLQGRVALYLQNKAWVVHRIDRDTSGAVLFAKDAAAHSFVCNQFEKGTVEKKYLALVSGALQEETGRIDSPILVEGRKVEIDPKGKESLTAYTVKERFRDFTLLEVEPHTGRRHQIRVHLQSLGHALAVDPEHGGREALFLSEFKKKYKKTGRERPLLGRLSLHAASITFNDPSSGKRITVESPLPDDFALALKQLRKHDV
ncbi:MAG: RluA family pseudouridine synthase [Endomicrobiales bacterium]